MTTASSHTLDVPGARLHYEVRGSGPVLLLLGLPMGSKGFTELASRMADEFTVVTYDPRGLYDSSADDPDEDVTPELVADDVHRLLAAITDEPAYVFGSSGGAVTAIALLERHPEQVRKVVLHEPPLLELLPERDKLRADVDDIHATYQREGQGAAWPKFFALTGINPAPPAHGPSEPAAQAEQQSEQDVAAGERMLGQCLRPTTRYRPDVEKLRGVSDRIVVAGGADSKGELANRTAAAFADEVGVALTEFDGDHAGFMGRADGFAEQLREALRR